VIDDFHLTAHDKAQPLWHRFKNHMLDRLVDARQRNDHPLLSETETAVLRGEIRCLRKLIALGDDPPILTGDDDQPPA
jgi:hypothetical protein